MRDHEHRLALKLKTQHRRRNMLFVGNEDAPNYVLLDDDPPFRALRGLRGWCERYGFDSTKMFESFWTYPERFLEEVALESPHEGPS